MESWLESIEWAFSLGLIILEIWWLGKNTNSELCSWYVVSYEKHTGYGTFCGLYPYIHLVIFFIRFALRLSLAICQPKSILPSVDSCGKSWKCDKNNLRRCNETGRLHVEKRCDTLLIFWKQQIISHGESVKMVLKTFSYSQTVLFIFNR